MFRQKLDYARGVRDGRADDALRPIRIERGFTRHAEGSVLIEFGDTDTLFTNPAKKQTEDYITGRYG